MEKKLLYAVSPLFLYADLCAFLYIIFQFHWDPLKDNYSELLLNMSGGHQLVCLLCSTTSATQLGEVLSTYHPLDSFELLSDHWKGPSVQFRAQVHRAQLARSQIMFLFFKQRILTIQPVLIGSLIMWFNGLATSIGKPSSTYMQGKIQKLGDDNSQVKWVSIHKPRG